MSDYTEYRVCVYPKGFFDEAEDRCIDPMYVFTQDYAYLREARRVAKALGRDHDVVLTKRTVTMEVLPVEEDMAFHRDETSYRGER